MRILSALSRTLLPFLLMIAAGALVVVVALTFVVSIWTAVEISAWNIAAAQIARWVAFWLGVYLIQNVLPIVVAHGRTRREFLWQAAVFSVVASAALAVISRIGFLVETLTYESMGWSREVTGNGFLEYWLMFAVWCGVGAFIAAGFMRFGSGGLLTIPIGFVLIIPAGALVSGANALPFIGSMPSLSGGNVVLLTLGTILVAGGLAWALAREAPIRTKAA